MRALLCFAVASATAVISACGTSSAIRSDVKLANWNEEFDGRGRKESESLTIATYYLPVQKVRIHLKFDDKGNLVEGTKEEPYGLSGFYVPGEAVRVRLPEMKRYETSVAIETKDGFLTKVTTETEDKLPTTISSIATEIQSLIPGAVSTTNKAAKSGKDRSEKQSPPAALQARMSKEIDVAVDPQDPTSLSKFNKDFARYGLCLVATSDEGSMDDKIYTSREPGSAEGRAGLGGVVVPVVFPYRAVLTIADESVSVGSAPSGGMSCEPEGENRTIDHTGFAPSKKKSVVLDVFATRWVKSSVAYSFDRGVFEKAEIKRGSVVQSVAQLPIDVFKAILSIPTQLIQFRINYDSSAEARAKVEVALLNELKALREAREAAAKKDEAKKDTGSDKLADPSTEKKDAA